MPLAPASADRCEPAERNRPMGIALLSLRQAEKVEPQLKAALNGSASAAKAAGSKFDRVKAGAAMGLTAREPLALRHGRADEAPAIPQARQSGKNTGRASARARVCPSVKNLGAADPLQK